MSPIRSSLVAVIVAAVCAISGCSNGPATGEVSGTVKVDGQIPAVGSSITFLPKDGTSSTAGATLDQGKYKAKVPVGLSRVEIRIPRPASTPDAPKEGPGGGPGGGSGLIEESLPDKYNNESTLTFDVKAGKNQKDWDLSTAP